MRSHGLLPRSGTLLTLPPDRQIISGRCSREAWGGPGYAGAAIERPNPASQHRKADRAFGLAMAAIVALMLVGLCAGWFK
jgi:hypothetical protein